MQSPPDGGTDFLPAANMLPATAAELSTSLNVVISKIDGKRERNVRDLPAQHTALIAAL